MFPYAGVFLFVKFGYFGEMNYLPSLRPRLWNLLISPPRHHLLTAIAYLARRADLIVLDCGRQFDSSIVARAAKGRGEVVDRIKVQRAFTCYEAAKLIERLPGGKTPIVILDFLSTFHDENVKMQSRKYLLETSLGHFQRLSRGTGLAVSVYVPSGAANSIYLFERLRNAAPRISSYEPMKNKTLQLRLF